jgi:hypothetical protein
MFEQAARLKLRFPSEKGSLNVEQLWDLPLTTTRKDSRLDLDSIAKDLYRIVKLTEEESFVVKVASASKVDKLRLDIVKFIINYKLAERLANKGKAEAKLFKDKVARVIAKKDDEDLDGMSREDLLKLL